MQVGIAHPAEFQEKEAEVKPDKLASVVGIIAQVIWEVVVDNSTTK